MRLREALLRHGGAHNRTHGIHIRVEACTVVDRDGPGEGYRVLHLGPFDITLKEPFKDKRIEEIEAFLAQPGNDPDTAAQDADAWTET